MDKTLKSKAISIKGKLYVQVADRVAYFNENYEQGSITTELLSKPEDDLIVVKATVRPNFEAPERVYTGHSQALRGGDGVNKASALENAETSAVGRALGMMGIGVLEGIASADEIHKAVATERLVDNTFNCENCKGFVSPKVKDFSVKKYGRTLCMKCQDEENLFNGLPK